MREFIHAMRAWKIPCCVLVMREPGSELDLKGHDKGESKSKSESETGNGNGQGGGGGGGHEGRDANEGGVGWKGFSQDGTVHVRLLVADDKGVGEGEGQLRGGLTMDVSGLSGFMIWLCDFLAI